MRWLVIYYVGMNDMKFITEFDDQGKTKEPSIDIKSRISIYPKIEYKFSKKKKKKKKKKYNIIENMCRQARKYPSDSQIKMVLKKIICNQINTTITKFLNPNAKKKYGLLCIFK